MQPIHLRESDEDAPTVRMPGPSMRRLGLDALTPPTAAPRIFRATEDGALVEASLDERSIECEAPVAAAVPAFERRGWDLERIWLGAATFTLAGLALSGVLLLVVR